MEIPGGGYLLRTLPPPEVLSGGSPCPVTPGGANILSPPRKSDPPSEYLACSLGPGLCLYALNLGEDNSTFLG